MNRCLSILGKRLAFGWIMQSMADCSGSWMGCVFKRDVNKMLIPSVADFVLQ
jgi:hypothetical protein